MNRVFTVGIRYHNSVGEKEKGACRSRIGLIWCFFFCSAPESKYSLCSGNSMLLVPVSFKYKVTLGDQAFQSAFTTLWRELPVRIRNLYRIETFIRAQNTLFFNLAFG